MLPSLKTAASGYTHCNRSHEQKSLSSSQPSVYVCSGGGRRCDDDMWEEKGETDYVCPDTRLFIFGSIF